MSQSERNPVTHRWPDPPADDKPAKMLNGMPVPGPVTVRIHRAIMVNGDMAIPGDLVENVPYPEAKAMTTRQSGHRAEIIEE